MKARSGLPVRVRSMEAWSGERRTLGLRRLPLRVRLSEGLDPTARPLARKRRDFFWNSPGARNLGVTLCGCLDPRRV